MPTNPTWSRAGAGQTGSIHDPCMLSLFANACIFQFGKPTGLMRGVTPMIIADLMVESKSAVLAQPMYADNASIWHHMSDALHQSLYRVLSLLIAILPGILAIFVALILFTGVGMAISAMLRR